MTPASVGFQCPECVSAGRAGVRAPRGGGLQSAGRRWGPVTLTLIGVNVGVFVVTAISAALAGGNPLNNNDSPLGHLLEQVPVLVRAGDWWRVGTAAFEHAGLLHIGLNMLALLIFGSELERSLGRWRYLALYGVSLLGGALAIQLFGDPNVAVVGASTAIFGLMGGMAVLLLAGRQRARDAINLVVINVVISIVIPGISLIGHLGGLVAGALTATVLVLTRRHRAVQGTGVAVLGAVLLVLALTVPSVVAAGL